MKMPDFNDAYNNLLLGNNEAARNMFEALAEDESVDRQVRADSEYMLGWIYYSGHCVVMDYLKALRWFKPAAFKNNERAMYYTGRICEKGGLGIEISIYNAFVGYSISALYGYEKAIMARDKVRKHLSDEEKEKAETDINKWMSLHADWVKDSPKPASS